MEWNREDFQENAGKAIQRNMNKIKYLYGYFRKLLDSSGNGLLVEAGGVEPPSEKVPNEKPTYLFSSLAFAADRIELTRTTGN